MAYDEKRSAYLLTLPKTKDVADELIRLNTGLAYTVLKQFSLYNDHNAISIAFETLYKAIITYNQNASTRFSTYATVSIYNRLGSYVRSLKTQINVNTISYDAIVDDETSYLSFMESSATADGRALQKCGIQEIQQFIFEYYKSIKNENHKAVLKSWIKSSYNKTNIQIANELSFSQSYVNQIIQKLRKELKNKLKGC